MRKFLGGWTLSKVYSGIMVDIVYVLIIIASLMFPNAYETHNFKEPEKAQVRIKMVKRYRMVISTYIK